MAILKMYNADLNAIGDTTQEAFDMVWGFRDWVLMDPAAALASDVIGRPVTTVEDMTTTEVRRTLASLSIPQPPTSVSKADLVGLLVAVVNGEAPADAVPAPQPKDPDGPLVNPADVVVPPSATPPSVYDPTAHVVDEVTAYLEGVDPAERDRVISAEKARTDRDPRVTIVNWAPPSA